MNDIEGRVRLALDILERHNAGKISMAQAAALIKPLYLPEVVALLEKTP